LGAHLQVLLFAPARPQVRELITQCWHPVPSTRPSFYQIRTMVNKLDSKCIEEWFAKGVHVAPSGARTANQLLFDVFPARVAHALRAGNKVEPEHHSCVTIFFSDVVGFTYISRILQHGGGEPCEAPAQSHGAHRSLCCRCTPVYSFDVSVFHMFLLICLSHEGGRQVDERTPKSHQL